MGALSLFAATGLNNLTLRGDTFASPPTVYLGFLSTPPAADASGVELTGGGYTRKAISFLPAAGGEIEQDTAVTWTALHSGADQMLAGWGIWDAASGGNLLAFGRTPAYRVRMGGGFTVPAGAISIACNGVGMSDYLANAWLDHLLGGTPYTAPGAVYVGHYLTVPTATTAGVEVTAAGYDRQTTTWDTAGVLDATATWAPLTTDDDQTLAGFAVLDANTGGNVLRFDTWPTPIEYTAGDTLEMAAGSRTLKAL